MRIGVLLEQALAPVPGGAGRYAIELAGALRRTGAERDTVSGWTAWHRDVRAAEVSGVPGPYRLALPRRALVLAWQWGMGPAPRGLDVLHAPSLLFPPARGTAQVVSIHDTVPWTHPQTLTPRGARWHRAMAARAVRTGATVAVLTEAVRAELLQVLPGLSSERVRVLGAGVADALRRPVTPEATARIRSRLGLPDRYVLSLATLEPRKGLDLLIESLGRLGPSAPLLLVVGQPGWGGVDLDSAARAAGLRAGAVRALGRIPDADLAVVLRCATMLAAPSLAEGFGLPVAEAMAAGTAVVCSDAPALAEVAGDSAVIVPRGDPTALAEAIKELLENDGLRERLITAGLHRSAAFTWEAVARRAWRLYADLGAHTGG